ncbi:MAG: DUF5071 domain-containing protein [Proteobacteria bacterium]|nr:DUF5071 domain-containing protein [Pseudomonadota bacterium]
MTTEARRKRLRSVYDEDLGAVGDDLLLFLPSDKGDTEPVARLESLTNEQTRDILPFLLTWIQDYNWPVAKAILPWLLKQGELLVEPIKRILSSGDEIWTYWVLDLLVRDLPIKDAFVDDLVRLAASESEEDIHSVAQEILDSMR